MLNALVALSVVLFVWELASRVGRVTPQIHERHSSYNETLKSIFTCNTVHELTNGTWIPSESSWQPSNCFLLSYHSEAVKQLLQSSKAHFLGSDVDMYHDSLCKGLLSSDTNVHYCSSMLPATFTPSLSYASEHVETYAELLSDGQVQTLILAFDIDTSSQLSAETFVSLMENLVSELRVSKYSGRIIINNLSFCSKTKKIRSLTELINRRMESSKGFLTRQVEVMDLGALTYFCDSFTDKLERTWKVHFAQVFYNALGLKQRPSFNQFTRKGTCALVSTAGYLSKFGNGRYIDGADYVVRAGVGQTKSFEDAVGSRTDMRILRQSIFERNRGNPVIDPEENVVVDFNSNQDILQPMNKSISVNRDLLLSRAVPYLTFYVGKSERVKASSLNACYNSSRDMTSGFRALLFLLEESNICSEVRALGFLGFLHKDQPYHYYDDGQGAKSASEQYKSRIKNGGHLFEHEQNCFLKLATHSDAERDILVFCPSDMQH